MIPLQELQRLVRSSRRLPIGTRKTTIGRLRSWTGSRRLIRARLKRLQLSMPTSSGTGKWDEHGNDLGRRRPEQDPRQPTTATSCMNASRSRANGMFQEFAFPSSSCRNGHAGRPRPCRYLL
ncbi:hypothetical protein pipiens_018784 [Culex pipiens pipiens]|uniref:Uncharacterized protein n=1 Tax=Culex pipiens pipiens TaxID=38569 RepID=A0ABD1DY04_CULPP